MSSAPLPADPKHKGTLACVVLKARNLPNKRSIGKQDPFAVLSIGSEKQKTKSDKRGGQHPTWDEQLHFEIYDDAEDVIKEKPTSTGDAECSETNTWTGTVKSGSNSRTASTSSVASGVPVKKAAPSGGKKILKIACYADDHREPDFIGEGFVDLKGVLKTGEFDEWVTIRSKDRYAGEVYLELTFFSSAPRPRRVKKTKPTQTQDSSYGGAGTFTADADESDFDSGSGPKLPARGKQHPSIPSFMRFGEGHRQHGRMTTSASVSTLSSRPFPSQSGVGGHPAGDEIPPTLRSSSSIADSATYTPPYAPQHIHRASNPQSLVQSTMSSSATMPSLDHHIRRESFPRSFTRSDLHSVYSAATSMSNAGDSKIPYGGLSEMPNSYSTSSMASSGTIRPSSTQPPPASPPYDEPIQDLMRPKTSMNVGTYPANQSLPPASTLVPVQSPHQHPSQTYHAPQQAHQSTWNGRNSQQAGSRVLSQAYVSEAHVPIVAPTPPPHPNSAPPTMPCPSGGYTAHHESQGQLGLPSAVYYQQRPDHSQAYSQSSPSAPAPQVHPAQTFVPIHGSMTNLAAVPSPSPQDAARVPAPAIPPHSPARTLSTVGYHVLPSLPSAQSYSYGSSQVVPEGSSAQVRPQPLPTPPTPGSQHSYASYQSGSVVNAKSLYHTPPAHLGGQYEGTPNAGRAPSPIPCPLSSFTQVLSHGYYAHSQQPGAAATPQSRSKPLPPVTPQGAIPMQQSTLTSYFAAPPPPRAPQALYENQAVQDYDAHHDGYTSPAPPTNAPVYSHARGSYQEPPPTPIRNPYESHAVYSENPQAAPTAIDYRGYYQPQYAQPPGTSSYVHPMASEQQAASQGYHAAH